MNESQIDKNSVVPIYYQVAKLLEGQIRRGELKPGQALPTETELATRFSISRMTVRRAISELVAAGMVYAQQGKGTFVASPKLDDVVFDLTSFDEEAEQRGFRYKTTLLQARIIRPDEALREKFMLSGSSTRLLYFETVLTAEDERLAYETKYAIYTKRKPILESELKDPTLPGLIAANSNYLPVSSKKVLKVALPSTEEAEVLGIPPDSPVFVIEQTVYDPELRPVGWGKSVYRGDRYQLTFYDGWLKK